MYEREWNYIHTWDINFTCIYQAANTRTHTQTLTGGHDVWRFLVTQCHFQSIPGAQWLQHIQHFTIQNQLLRASLEPAHYPGVRLHTCTRMYQDILE